jgi:hypothetical protein
MILTQTGYGIGVPSLARKMFKEMNVYPPNPQLSFIPAVQPTIDILRSLEIPYFDSGLFLHGDFTGSDVGKMFSSGIIVPDGYILHVTSLALLHSQGVTGQTSSGLSFDRYVYSEKGVPLCTLSTSSSVQTQNNVNYNMIKSVDAYGVILFPGTELQLKLYGYIAFANGVGDDNGSILEVYGKLQYIGGLLDEIKNL